LAKCAKDTAIRDIQDLVEKDILQADIPGAKRPSYSIIYNPEDIAAFFLKSELKRKIVIKYIKALYKGKTPVRERILPWDAKRFENGDLSLENLHAKYCSYVRMN